MSTRAGGLNQCDSEIYLCNGFFSPRQVNQDFGLRRVATLCYRSTGNWYSKYCVFFDNLIIALEFTPFSIRCTTSNNINDLSLWLHFLTFSKNILHEVNHMLYVNEITARKTSEFGSSSGFKFGFGYWKPWKPTQNANVRSKFGTSKLMCFFGGKKESFFLNSINICKMISISLD